MCTSELAYEAGVIDLVSTLEGTSQKELYKLYLQKAYLIRFLFYSSCLTLV